MKPVWKHTFFWPIITSTGASNFANFICRCFFVLKREEIVLVTYIAWALSNQGNIYIHRGKLGVCCIFSIMV